LASIYQVTGLSTVARITVVADQRVSNDAPNGRVAGFDAVAHVSVVTYQRRAAGALSLDALVLGGTDIAVIAGKIIVHVRTPGLRRARIIRTYIPVVALHIHATGAHTFGALVADGAGVPVVAEEPLVVGDEGALPRGRVTVVLEAKGVLPFWVRAFDDRFGVYDAFVRELLRVADEGAVAKVIILKAGAILIALAVAGHSRAFALPHYADIANRARVFIIAFPGSGRILTAAGLGANIVCALVAVVALNGVTDTDTLVAVVGNCTGVSIIAGTGIENGNFAAVLSQTFVLGAVVVVIAQVDEVAFHQNRLIDITVAVVVQTVASLPFGHRGVTVAEAVFFTEALPITDAKFVLHFAGRPQPQGHGSVGTGALACIVDALLKFRPSDRQDILAGETPWARLVVSARPAAETALVTVYDAGVIGAGDSLTVFSFGARAAQVGVVGDAYKNQIRGGARHLLAGPPFGALFLAGLGTHLLPHMLHAPAGVAFVVLGAAVLEAAFPRLALERGNLCRLDIRHNVRGDLDLPEVGFDDHLKDFFGDVLLCIPGIFRQHVSARAGAGPHQHRRHQ